MLLLYDVRPSDSCVAMINDKWIRGGSADRWHGGAHAVKYCVGYSVGVDGTRQAPTQINLHYSSSMREKRRKKKLLRLCFLAATLLRNTLNSKRRMSVPFTLTFAFTTFGIRKFVVTWNGDQMRLINKNKRRVHVFHEWEQLLLLFMSNIDKRNTYLLPLIELTVFLFWLIG